MFDFVRLCMIHALNVLGNKQLFIVEFAFPYSNASSRLFNLNIPVYVRIQQYRNNSTRFVLNNASTRRGIVSALMNIAPRYLSLSYSVPKVLIENRNSFNGFLMSRVDRTVQHFDVHCYSTLCSLCLETKCSFLVTNSLVENYTGSSHQIQ